MYIRAAKNRDELWLLEQIESLGIDETAFRSRDYVIAVDEETNEKAGFGRIRIHKDAETEYCELTSLGVLDKWEGRGIGAHVIERLVEKASDEGFTNLYAFFEDPDYFSQFGFEEIDEDDLPETLSARLVEKRNEVSTNAVALRVTIDDFTMPRHLREAFKEAENYEQSVEPEERPEDFGIDPETATYKYDTGRRK